MKNYSYLNSIYKYWYLWFIVALLIITNLYLAVMSWQEIRDSIGWVKNIPQKTDFKLRHFVQFSPQAFFLSFTLETTFNLSSKKSALIATLVLTFTGITSETIQYFAPTRIASLTDVSWNFLASVLGACIYIIFRKTINKSPSDK